MDYLIFGDDWGRHPSTTQHLVRALPNEDRVLWLNSIGMRSPGPGDLRRVAQKLRAMSSGEARAVEPGAASVDSSRLRVCSPKVLPWHRFAPARSVNRRSLARLVQAQSGHLDKRELCVIYSNPVAAFYLDAIPHQSSLYLRLDEYEKLPGVDPVLCREAEARAYRDADCVAVTAKALLPEQRKDALYVPQGVDFDHFASVPAVVPKSKTLGFFGLLESWLDYELIIAVARRLPDWTFEFIGEVRNCPSELQALANVQLRGRVPYSELPSRLDQWRAAWVPFKRNKLTMGVNPLKAREYLAAGLPTLCTPLPELLALQPSVRIVETAAEVEDGLLAVLSGDSDEVRSQRKANVRDHSWEARAQQLRAGIQMSRSKTKSPTQSQGDALGQEMGA